MDYTITPKEFEQFRSLIYQECGISLNESNKILLVSRLSKRLRTLELDSFQAYYDMVAGETEGEEFTLLLDFVSTNKTDFFREPKHFDFLREQILPTLQSTRRVRIWSSASSSGEEPYTIAMTLHDSVPDPERWDCKILASAGHAGTILCSPHHPSVWLSHTDLPLGFDPEGTFTTRQDQVQCGDRLYLTSDGIYETLSPEQELWGKERLQEVLERDAARSVDEVMDHCVQASRTWQQAEHFPDDAALVCLERTT